MFLNPAIVTAGVIHGVYWVTTLSEGRLSSMLEIDSGSTDRKFRILKSVSPHSILAADINFDSDHRWKYADFPADSMRPTETLFLYEDSNLVGRQVIPVSNEEPEIRLIPDSLYPSPNGYNSWELKLPDSTVYAMSITVSDADRSVVSLATIDQLAEAYTDDLTVPDQIVDSSYISFTGKATKENYLFGGKKIKDPFSREIVMTGVRDSNFVFIKTVRIDEEGNFRLDSLFFFGAIDLQFQINKEEDGSTKNVHLSVFRFLAPPIDTSAFSNCVDEDRPIGKEDTTFTAPELSRYELARVKTLKAATVRHWESPHMELDHLYTSGAFSEPSMYSFDVRTERRFHDIGSYMRMQLGMLGGYNTNDTPSLHGHSIIWFVDQ
jgi:hypothetical protein